MTDRGKLYQLTVVTGPWDRNRIIRDLLLVASGSILGAIVRTIRRRLSKKGFGLLIDDARASMYRKFLDPLSQEVIESRSAVDRLICSQYLSTKDLFDISAAAAGGSSSLPDVAQLGSLSTCVSRVGVLAERHCEALRDFTGERGETTALDIGCTVGGLSFELARSFQMVYAVDPSRQCINAAETMKSRGWMRCDVSDETDLHTEKTVAIEDQDIDRSRVDFAVMSFEQIQDSLSKTSFDCVASINALTRMENPRKFLKNVFRLVRPKGGTLVIGSTFDWSEDSTPRQNWLGGYVSKDGTRVESLQALKDILSKDFDLITQEDIPCFVRDSSRRIVMTVQSVTVWKRH